MALILQKRAQVDEHYQNLTRRAYQGFLDSKVELLESRPRMKEMIFESSTNGSDRALLGKIIDG